MNVILKKNIIRIVITLILALLLTGVGTGSVNPTPVGKYDTARAAYGVVKLPLGVMVEIETIAFK